MITWLRYFALTIGVVAVIALIIIFAGLRTVPGQIVLDKFSRPIIEKIVNEQLGSTISYARPRGALPGELILEDITLTDADGIWAEIRSISVKWRPIAALRGQYLVDELTIRDAILFREPPTVPEKNDQQTVDERNFAVPTARIGSLLVNGLTLRPEVLGQQYDLKVSGTAAISPRAATANIKFYTAGDTDLGTIHVTYDGKTLKTLASVFGQADGVIANATKANGTVWIAVNGEGSTDNWSGEIEGEFGEYGRFASLVNGDLRELSFAEMKIGLEPGTAVSADVAALLGDQLTTSLSIAKDGAKIVLTVSELTTALGSFSGYIAATLDEGFAAEYNIRGNLLAPPLTTLGADILAGHIGLTGSVKSVDKKFNFDAALTSVLGILTIEKGTSTADNPFAGNITFTATDTPVTQPQIQALLIDGGEFSSSVTVPAIGSITAENLSLRFGKTKTPRMSAKGRAQFDPSSGAIEAAINLNIGSALLNTLSGSNVIASTTRMDLNATGTTDSLTLTVNGTTPSLTLGDTQTAPGSLNLSVFGLLKSPSANFTLTAIDKSYDASGEITNENGVLTIPKLAFDAQGISVSTKGDFNLSSGAVNFTADAKAPKGVLLPTGDILQGVAKIDIVRAANTESLAANITSNELTIGQFSVGSLSASASGPPADTKIQFNAKNADLGNTFLPRVEVMTQVNIAAAKPVITVTTMELAIDTDIEEQRITLTAPATITLGETISLTPTKLKWLGSGTIEATASYAPTQWQATAAGANIHLPGINAPADFTLTLDTSNDTRAVFAATVAKSDIAGMPIGKIDLTGKWAGNTLSAYGKANDSDAGDVLTFSLDLPMHLAEASNALTIKVPNQELSGLLIIDGPIDTLLAYAPELPISASGHAEGEFIISGTRSAPAVNGSFSLDQARLEDDFIGTSLQNVVAKIALVTNGTKINGTIDATASDTKNRPNAVTLSGLISSGPENAGNALTATLTLDKATLVDSAELEFISDARLDLSGPLESLSLAGNINIRTLDAQIPENAPSGSAASDATYTPIQVIRVDSPVATTITGKQTDSPVINLDLTINADNRLFVRGRGLDSEWTSDLHITGTSGAPSIAGTADVRNGTFRFAGRTFNITKGHITFNPDNIAAPRIDISAAYDTGEITAVMAVTGTAAAPKINLTSTPMRPQEDVLALLLFGKLPTQLSALESLQIANALAQLTGTGPFAGGSGGIGNTLRSGIGLDSLSVGIDPETGLGQVEVGKYISDEVYVSAKQAAGSSGTEITVTYEVNDNVTVESTIKENGAQNVSANYKRDY